MCAFSTETIVCGWQGDEAKDWGKFLGEEKHEKKLIFLFCCEKAIFSIKNIKFSTNTNSRVYVGVKLELNEVL